MQYSSLGSIWEPVAECSDAGLEGEVLFSVCEIVQTDCGTVSYITLNDGDFLFLTGSEYTEALWYE